MPKRNLRIKFSLYLILALSPVMVALPLFIVGHQQERLQDEISRHAIQTAELIVKSTRHAMLTNQRDIAEKIIQDIGRQDGIERVRVLNKDGTIIHSNRSADVGHSVEQKSDTCIHCHHDGRPLDSVPEGKNWRIYSTGTGTRLLGTMAPIRNEPSCSTASCHEHPASQTVLGVVDVAYSLDAVDASMRRETITIAAVSFAVVVLVALAVGLLLRRLIYLPLSDLEAGATRLSQGELGHAIPVRSDDEFGHVAGSFNHMSQALQRSIADLQELVQTLESKVERRTQELRVAEAEVAQGEKLASVGLLASGIAHELNNPLTGVLTFTSLLRKKLPDDNPDAQDLDLVIAETKRCAAIIRRLLDFAREKVPSQSTVELNRIVADTVRFVERQAALQRIEIALDLDPALPAVWGDADLIKQVVMNILVNATQAISGGGRIDVATRSCAEPGSVPAPAVEIVIRDTGCGIAPSDLQRIFDPFFTSKEVGKGTGLGLSVSYGIVKAHGGAIKVDSRVGEGSTFRVVLPAATPAADAADRPGGTAA